MDKTREHTWFLVFGHESRLLLPSPRSRSFRYKDRKTRGYCSQSLDSTAELVRGRCAPLEAVRYANKSQPSGYGRAHYWVAPPKPVPATQWRQRAGNFSPDSTG